MTGHAEDTLRSAGIAQILNLALAIPAPEAVGTEGLVAGQNGQILDFVTTVVAAICTVVAYQRAVAEQQQVRIRIEEGAARVAAEAVDMPSVSGWAMLAYDMLTRWSGASGGARKAQGWSGQARVSWCLGGECIPSSKALPSSRI
jgi:hypothetical protein